MLFEIVLGVACFIAGVCAMALQNYRVVRHCQDILEILEHVSVHVEEREGGREVVLHEPIFSLASRMKVDGVNIVTFSKEHCVQIIQRH